MTGLLSHGRIVLVFALLAATLAFPGCTGSEQNGAAGQLEQAALQPGDLPGGGAGLPPLPDDAAEPRVVSVEVEQTKTGDQAFMQSDGAEVFGNIIVLESSVDNPLQYAIFQLPVGTDEPLRYSANISVTAGDYWLMVANYELNQWVISEALTDSQPEFEITQPADIVSPGGYFYLGVVTAKHGAVYGNSSVFDVTLVVEDGTVPQTYSVGGTITELGTEAPIEGVTVQLSPGGASETTNASGEYLFTEVQGGEYTITPSLAGYDFTPPSLDVTVTDADITGQDFTGELQTYSISGTITDADTEAPLEGVTVELNPGGLVESTNASGAYQFSDLAPGDYTVVPSLPDFVFEPPTRDVTITNSDVPGQNFSGSPELILNGLVMSGEGGLIGAEVHLIALNEDGSIDSGGYRMETTDAEGNFQFDNMQLGEYRLVPMLDGYAFEPNILQFIFEDSMQMDFIGEPVEIPDNVTYVEHMLPWLFEPICMQCHDSNKTGPDRNFAPASVDWDTYDGTTEPSKISANTRIQADTMPPAMLNFHTSAFQKDLYQLWLEGGFQEN